MNGPAAVSLAVAEATRSKAGLRSGCNGKRYPYSPGERVEAIYYQGSTSIKKGCLNPSARAWEDDCKHGVAVVLEYLERIKNNRPVPRADKNDERFSLVGAENWENQDEDEGTAASVNIQKEINTFLKDKTKTQLIKLINELAEQFPGMAQTLADRKQLTSGDTKALVTRLRREIREIGDEEGWQNYWEGEGYTPDYSGIRTKLEALLKSGHADEVLSLGKELIQCGTRQVEESHDEGETGMEVATCFPAVIKALDQSSLSAVDKLAWAVDVLLKDQYELCEDFAEYLHMKHPKAAWHALADQLLAQLNRTMPDKGANNFSRNFERDLLSDWIIHALEQAGRTEEVIPLCEAEAARSTSLDHSTNGASTSTPTAMAISRSTPGSTPSSNW